MQNTPFTIKHQWPYSLVAICTASLLLFVSLWQEASHRIFAVDFATASEPMTAENLKAVFDEIPLIIPTILPNEPGYVVKVIQDKIEVMSTPETQAKARVLMYQSDERLAAAIFLYGEGRQLQAIETLIKAEKYLEDAWLVLIEDADLLSQDSVQKLDDHLKDHQKVLKLLEAQTDLSLMGIFSRATELNKLTLSKVEQGLLRDGEVDLPFSVPEPHL